MSAYRQGYNRVMKTAGVMDNARKIWGTISDPDAWDSALKSIKKEWDASRNIGDVKAQRDAVEERLRRAQSDYDARMGEEIEDFMTYELDEALKILRDKNLLRERDILGKRYERVADRIPSHWSREVSDPKARDRIHKLLDYADARQRQKDEIFNKRIELSDAKYDLSAAKDLRNATDKAVTGGLGAAGTLAATGVAYDQYNKRKQGIPVDSGDASNQKKSPSQGGDSSGVLDQVKQLFSSRT